MPQLVIFNYFSLKAFLGLCFVLNPQNKIFQAVKGQKGKRGTFWKALCRSPRMFFRLKMANYLILGKTTPNKNGLHVQVDLHLLSAFREGEGIETNVTILFLLQLLRS